MEKPRIKWTPEPTRQNQFSDDVFTHEICGKQLRYTNNALEYMKQFGQTVSMATAKETGIVKTSLIHSFMSILKVIV